MVFSRSKRKSTLISLPESLSPSVSSTVVPDSPITPVSPSSSPVSPSLWNRVSPFKQKRKMSDILVSPLQLEAVDAADDHQSISSSTILGYPSRRATTDDTSPIGTGLKLRNPRRTVSNDHENVFTQNKEAISTGRSIAILVARGATLIGEATNVPYLKGIAGLAHLILESVDKVAVNKEDCERLAEHVIELYDVISTNFPDRAEEVHPNVIYEIGRLQETFQKVFHVVRRLAERKFTQRLIRQDDDAQIIADCERELKRAFDFFNVTSTLRLHSATMNISNVAHEHHFTTMETLHSHHRQTLDTIRTVFEEKLILERSSTSPTSPMSPGSPLYRSSMIPSSRLPPPHAIFHGREKELSTLLDIVSGQSSPRIAILGPGGIGKSSLCLALLHHRDTEALFGPRRFFIPCDSTSTLDDLLSMLASNLGLLNYPKEVGGSKLTNDIVQWLSDPQFGPCILVLDNFETPWEPKESKMDVEEFLKRIANIDSVILLVTMRGAEKPFGILWTSTFPSRLEPLDPIATRQIFMDIVPQRFGRKDQEAELDAMVDLSGNYPLAVELIANLLQTESVGAVLRRWNAESKRELLDRGNDKKTSIWMSIKLSLESPRLLEVPHARDLLTVLSFLPDGVRRSELELIVPKLPNVEKCASKLIQTSLAYSDGGGDSDRMKILDPIRSFINDNLQLPLEYMASLESYVWDLLKLTDGIEYSGAADIIRRIASELGNIRFVTERALKDPDGFDPAKTIQAVLKLAQFYRHTSLGSHQHLPRAAELAHQLGLKKLEAECLYMSGYMSGYPEYTNTGLERALVLYKELDNKAGQADCWLQVAYRTTYKREWTTSEEAADSAYKLYTEAKHVPGQVKTLLLLGRQAIRRGELRNAASKGFQARELVCSQLGNLTLEAMCLQFIGDMYMYRSSYKYAGRYCRQSIRLFEALDLHRSPIYMNSITTLGEIDQLCCEPAAARVWYTKGLHIYQKHRIRDREAYCLRNLGLVALALGDVGEARILVESSMKIWDALQNPWGKGICLAAFGDIAMQDSDLKRAAKRYRQARYIFFENSFGRDEAECHMRLGDISFNSETPDRPLARTQYVVAFLIFRKNEELLGQAHCLQRFGDLFAAEGDYNDASSLFETASWLYDRMGVGKEKQNCVAKLIEVQTA